jgi:hypothetical protein
MDQPHAESVDIMASLVVRDLEREFRGVVPPELIDLAARESVSELANSARVQTFIPVLAHRRARQRLRQQARAAS